MGEFREKEGDQTVSEFEKTRHKLPRDSAARKRIPITSGVLDYFPRAIAAVAEVSVVGNDKHNPGQPIHWAKHKSMDQADCIARHLIERGGIDEDGIRHSAHLVWRALALLEEELARAEGTWEQEVRACRDRDPMTATEVLKHGPVRDSRRGPDYGRVRIAPEECVTFDGHVYSGGECVYCETKKPPAKGGVLDPSGELLRSYDESEDINGPNLRGR